MKDAIDRELRRGDLILDIRGVIGMVEGTQTPTGHIRIVSVWGGHRTFFKKKNSLKIPLELFNEVYRKMIKEYGSQSEEHLNALMKGRDEIMNIVHKGYL